ncbi:nuclear transport factor 2 family protein [Sphingobacterium sp. WQ 366]|uniref:Nuclear transport factor 2 family protein n=1 Tax=Sphingobacterium bovistauri TaxID=2781959 RepID=A0ABS7Z407_9SPHI|nr:nuclear transport factor 2 family protein [Sphingobacterium bovistauri]
MNIRKIVVLPLLLVTLIACGQKQNSAKKEQNLDLNKSIMQSETILKPVKTLIEAMQAENADLIKAQFSQLATQAYGAEGKMKTPEETRKWIQSDILDRNGKVANPEYTIISEKEVVVKGQYSSEGYTNKANFLFTVENGLITSWRMRY